MVANSCITDRILIDLNIENVTITEFQSYEQDGFTIEMKDNILTIIGDPRAERMKIWPIVFTELIESGHIKGLTQNNVNGILNNSNYEWNCDLIINYDGEWTCSAYKCATGVTENDEVTNYIEIIEESLDFGTDDYVTGEPRTSDPGPTAQTVTHEENDNTGISSILGIIISIVIVGSIITIGYQIFVTPQINNEIIILMKNQTRQQILNELIESEKIPSYFSNKLHKSRSTISEHLDKMVIAGLIEKKAEHGRKFVYYKLTRKGKIYLRFSS